MSNSACKHIYKEQSTNEYIFETDFEYIVYEEDEYEDKCMYLKDEEIIFVRFIYSKYLNNFFPLNEYQMSQLNKYFFLPTHKAKEFRSTLNNEGKSDLYSKELEDFYTTKMIANFKLSEYYTNIGGKSKIHPERREGCSTSLFILHSNERFRMLGDISVETILKLSDIEGLDDGEKKSIILNSGLDICQQIPMYDFCISYGQIKLNQGILEWDKTFRTENPEPGSSHVHFFKLDKAIGNEDFQIIADQFTLIDTEVVKRPKKREGSKRRKELISET